MSLCILLFLLSAEADAQLSAIKPARILPLIAEGDPTKFCYNNMVMDSTGRLWFKTCSVADLVYDLHVLQFDGYERWPISLAKKEWKEQLGSYLNGASPLGFIYGFYNRYPKESNLYTYDFGSHQLKHTPLPEGIVGDIVEYAPGKFWVLGKTKLHFEIHHWDGTSLELRYTIPNKTHYWPDQQRFANGVNSNLIYADDTFWIYDRELPIIAFYPSSQTIKTFDQADFAFDFSRPRPPTADFFAAKASMAYRDSSLYICNAHLSSNFFKLTKQNNKEYFVPLPFNEEGNHAKSVHQDEQGNLLFVFEFPYLNRKRSWGAYLLDRANNVFDYSPMFEDLAKIQNVVGRNFKKEAFVLTAVGAYLVQAQQKSTITTFPGANNIRSLGQVGANDFLFRSNKYDLGINLLKNGVMMPDSLKECILDPIDSGGRKDLLTDPNGMVWFKNEEGIYRYEPDQNGQCIAHPLDFESSFGIFLSLDQAAFVENETNKLIIYNLQTRQREDLSYPEIQFQRGVHYLYLAKDKILWVAATKGLYRVNTTTGEFKLYDEAAGFEDPRVLVIKEDQQGLLWLGTTSRGLHVFDPKKEEVVNVIDDSDGLSNNIIVGILEDDDGDIWAASYNGLTILRPSGEVITILNETDGLLHHEFNRYAHFKANDGRLFFGSQGGMHLIDPQKIKEELRTYQKSKIYISRLSYFDTEVDRIVHRQNYIPSKERLVLAADKRFLSISLGMSNYGLNAKNTYAYKIEGKEEEWNSMGYEHFIRLPNLPAGKYNLLIASIDQKGNWSANTIRIPIRAKEFFYKQSWFYLLLSLPFVIFGLLWVRRLSKERDLLEREVDKRTIQIRKDKELIEQQAHELKQLDQMKSKFFANISHDFRTPLTLITGPAELIEQEEIIAKRPRIKQSLQSILQNGKKLLQLVDEILDLAKLDSNQVRLHEEELELYDFCEDIFRSYEAAAQRKQMLYRLDFEGDTAFRLITDPRRLEKILNNLLGNAFKFTPEKGEILFRIFFAKEEVYFAIKDSGTGIPNEDLPHIFDRYFQSKQDQFAISTGSGIGLSLSQELAKLMGGEIQVESEFGQGATFTLTLPAKGAAASDLIPTKQDQVSIDANLIETILAPAQNGQRSKVLVVEDNLEVQTFLKDLLQDHYKVISCNNGLEAVQFFEQSATNGTMPIDLILSDINMPKMDGYELLTHIKSAEKLQQIPVIMLTARTKEKSKLKALRMGVDDYLTKPFSPTELLLRIHNLLHNYQQRQAYQKEYHQVAPAFKETPSADQTWLAELEKNALDALDKKIDLNIAYLSSVMNISERQLSRKIKLLTGLTIGKYIQEIKLQKARHLLENRIINSVADASYLSGFKSPSYFTQLYVQYYGKKPSVYL